VIQLAAYQLGGWERLVAWVKEDPENERLFWCSMFARLLPTQLMGNGENGAFELNAKIKPEEMASQIMARGLPPCVFGLDAPTLDQSDDDVPLPAVSNAPSVSS
jgi:hypothetical protein